MSRHGARHKYAFCSRPPPREGTRKRKLYEDLMAGRCARFNIDSRDRDDMRDYHGFELERVAPKTYRATGKYEGSVFVPIWPSL